MDLNLYRVGVEHFQIDDRHFERSASELSNPHQLESFRFLGGYERRESYCHTSVSN